MGSWTVRDGFLQMDGTKERLSDLMGPYWGASCGS